MPVVARQEVPGALQHRAWPGCHRRRHSVPWVQRCSSGRRPWVADQPLRPHPLPAPSTSPIYVNVERWRQPDFGAAPHAARDAHAVLLTAAIAKHGYPAKADASQIGYVPGVLLLTVLVIYVTMVYGPIAAWLVELFPTRIRYSGLSLPYHIGNGWFGGFLPATVFAIVAATGDIYSGLWYPAVIAAMSFVVGLLFLPETKNVDITRI